MYNVCAKYCGSVIMLAECNTEKEAKDFMKEKYLLCPADGTEYVSEDEIIYPYEMFVEEDKQKIHLEVLENDNG